MPRVVLRFPLFFRVASVGTVLIRMLVVYPETGMPDQATGVYLLRLTVSPDACGPSGYPTGISSVLDPTTIWVEGSTRAYYRCI